MRKQVLCWLLLIGFPVLCFPEDNRSNVVLVTASDTDFPSISQKELRRLYLGLSLAKGSVYLSPVINKHDPEILNGFLQNIMFMTDRNYKRQLVTRVFRSGGELPKEFSKTGALHVYLREYKGSVSFMYESEAVTDNHLRIVKTLW